MTDSSWNIHCRRLAARADLVLVEGAGGWLAPISSVATMADIAEKLGLPVVFVVGLRLGCINHALLTAQAVQAAGSRLIGWVASHVDPEVPDGYLAALKERLPAPLIGNFRHGIGDADAANAIDFDSLGL